MPDPATPDDDRTENASVLPVIAETGSTLAADSPREATMVASGAPEGGVPTMNAAPFRDETMHAPTGPATEKTMDAAAFASRVFEPEQTAARPAFPERTMAQAQDASPERTQVASHIPSLPTGTRRPMGRPSGTISVPGYELIEPVGKGGMGIVFRAKQVLLDRDIAIKFLRDDFHPKSATGLRFLEEARITAQLQHPGIPAVHEVGYLKDERPYLVMKLIRGRTLDVMLKEQGPGSTRWLPVFEAICHAVGFAHSHGVLHRDLKPSNIMVGAFGEVQVMDWGLAKVLGKEGLDGHAEPGTAKPDDGTEISSLRESESIETRAGSYLGTPAFMAPEQATGDIAVMSPRTDVFGLGAILCTLITGKPPYLAATAEATRLQAAACKLDEAVARLEVTTADPELIDLCKRCMANDPKDRPASGGVVALQIASLRSYAEDRAKQAELARARSEVAVAEQKKRRRVMTFAGSAIIAVLSAGIAYSTYSFYEAKRARDEEAKQKGIAEQEKVHAQDEEKKAKAAEEEQRIARKVADDQRAISDATLTFFLEDLLRQAEARVRAKALLKFGITEPSKDNPTIRELLDRAARHLSMQEIDKRFPGQLEVQAKILRTVGQTYRGIGDFKSAIVFLERADVAYGRVKGPGDKETLETQNQLALAYQAAGRMKKAVSKFQEVLETEKQVNSKWDAEHPDDPHGNTLDATTNLALAFMLDNRLPEAIRFFESTRAAYLKKWGPDSEITLTGQVSLATAYYMHGEFRKAIDLLDDALKRRIRLLGPNNPDTLSTRKVMADAILAQGLQAQANAKNDREQREADAVVSRALVLFKEVLAGYATAFSEDHPDTLHAENSLANAYLKAGDGQAALKHLKHIFEVQKTKFGDNHPDTVTAVSNLGSVFEALQQLDAAIEHYLLGARGVVKLKYEHQHARAIFRNLAAAYETKKLFAEAEPWWREWQIVVKQEEEEGIESLEYARTCAVLGRNFYFQKKWADAAKSFREGLKLREKLQPGEWGTFNLQSFLGSALYESDEKDEGQKLMEAGFEGMMKLADTIPNEAKYNLLGAGDRLLALYEATKQDKKAAALKMRLDPLRPKTGK